MGAGESVTELDRAHVWHPYAAVGAPVHQVVRAEGVRLTLADGRVLIDGMSSWWAAIHGYNHPRLNQAVTAQLADMAHVMFGGLTHEPAVRLAQRLAAMTGLPKVFFADSGSVAVEVAIKMAIQHSGSSRLMTVRGGYHGDTFGAMAVCDPVNGMHQLFTGALPQHVFAPVPPAHLDEDYLDLLGELVTPDLAAVILEPIVQGAGGMRFYHPSVLRRLRELTEQRGVLLIADEIATGFGRTGELFGCDHAGIRPDVMCVGKALTGGYMTLAATLCTDAVAERIGVLMHGPTYMANPLATAVANASLDLLAERPWREEVARIEAQLKQGLAGVGGSRVLGAIGVIEQAEPVDVAKVQQVAMDHGVWLRPFGRLIYTMPPYACTAQEVEQIIAAMVAASA